MKYDQSTSLYGLPAKVVHCKFCVLNNQLPFSVNESKSKKGKSKQGLEDAQSSIRKVRLTVCKSRALF